MTRLRSTGTRGIRLVSRTGPLVLAIFFAVTACQVVHGQDAQSDLPAALETAYLPPDTSFAILLRPADLSVVDYAQPVVDAFDGHRDADFVHGDALVIDDESGDVELMWRLPFDLDFIRRIGFLSQPAVFWRRQAYEQLGPFDGRLEFVADCDYWMHAGQRHHFLKVNEFLAVERDHAATARGALSAQVWPELEEVRARYVSLSGAAHDQRVRWHARRFFFFFFFFFYRRLYSTTLLAQSFIPRGFVRGPWGATIASGHLGIQRRRLIARLVPFLGPRLVERYVSPDRFWLTPADRQEVTRLSVVRR